MAMLDANRARGQLTARFVRVGARTEVATAFETGGYRLRMPRSHGPACEAVMVNTGGGMVAGDHAAFAFVAEPGAAVTLTTTAAEKIYRSDGPTTRLDVALEASAGARLHWLPQETILFDGARLERRLDATLASDAHLLMGEMLVYGRLAMGETMRVGSVRDRWRVRRGGKLILAEELALVDDVAALLDAPALGAGARASATLLLVSSQAETCLDSVRAILDTHAVVAGASAWDGMLVLRGLSPSPERLRGAIVEVLTALRGGPLPRPWL